MNDRKFSDYQIEPVLKSPAVLESAELYNFFLKILTWMYFPSSEHEEERETAKEILKTFCLNHTKEALKKEFAKELTDDFSFECFSKDFSALLHLSPEQEGWINRPFTLNGLRENQRTRFEDYQRVFALLMECLEQGDGNFTRAFTTLKIDYKLPKKNKRKKLIQNLGCQDFFRKSYHQFKSVTPFILAFCTVALLLGSSLEKKLEDDKTIEKKLKGSITILHQWCLFYKEKLLALKIPRVPEPKSYILRSEWLPPVDLEKHIALSDEETAAFDQQRRLLWKEMKNVFMKTISKG